MTDPINQNDPDAWNQAGKEYENQRDYPNAIRCFTRATELNPDFLDAWTRKGFLCIKQGMFEDADVCKVSITEIKEKATVEAQKFQEVVRVPKSVSGNTVPIATGAQSPLTISEKMKNDTYSYKGWMTSDYFLKRAFGTYFHVLCAHLIIVGVFLIIIIFLAVVVAAFVFGMAGATHY